MCYLDQCGKLEENTDYSGNDLMSGGAMGRIPKIMSSADECRQACIDLKDCFGFTFVKSDKTRHNCAVKKEWRHESKTRSTCCDSGQVTNACRKGNVAWIELRSFKGKFIYVPERFKSIIYHHNIY